MSNLFLFTEYSKLYFLEDTVKIADIISEMELNGVDSADIADIIHICEQKGFSDESIDEELLKKGYNKIFTIDYDSYEEYAEWEDDDYQMVEKFPHRRQFD